MCRLTYTKRYTFLNGNRKENEMDEFKFNVETTVIGTADGKETFEVRKQYNVDVKSAIIYKKNLYSAREQISKIQNAAIVLNRSKLY